MPNKNLDDIHIGINNTKYVRKNSIKTIIEILVGDFPVVSVNELVNMQKISIGNAEKIARLISLGVRHLLTEKLKYLKTRNGEYFVFTI